MEEEALTLGFLFYVVRKRKKNVLKHIEDENRIYEQEKFAKQEQMMTMKGNEKLKKMERLGDGE